MINRKDASNLIFFANLAGCPMSDDGSRKNRPFSQNFPRTISVLVRMRIYI
jgi:hypothetical protein